jgi:hypothetical protein
VAPIFDDQLRDLLQTDAHRFGAAGIEAAAGGKLSEAWDNALNFLKALATI